MKTSTTAPATRSTKKPLSPLSTANALLSRYSQLLMLIEANKEAIKPLEVEAGEIKAKLQEWSEQHPAEFGDKKMLQLGLGSFGFRAGTKSIAFPEDAPDDIQAKYLKAVLTGYPTAIEQRVDSKKVINAWDALPSLRKQLERLGLSIKQPDQFIISLKK